MPLLIEGFPLCCTARVVCDFGQEENSDGRHRLISKETLIEDLKEQIDQYKRYGMATLVATITSDQKEAKKALKECGFKYSKWMKKKNHPETRLRVYWKELQDS